jgi:hypothetical protein
MSATLGLSLTSGFLLSPPEAQHGWYRVLGGILFIEDLDSVTLGSGCVEMCSSHINLHPDHYLKHMGTKNSTENRVQT